MAEKINVITAKEVIKTDTISFKFMFDSGAPNSIFLKFGGVYGLLGLNKESRWEVFLGSNARQIFSGSATEELPNESGLQELLTNMPNCVLLMEKNVFDRFNRACKNLDIPVAVFHYQGILTTS